MVLLRLLVFGLGLGDVFICDRNRAAEADVGCAINCADFQMDYRPGVKPYWLHIAYHGWLDSTSWQDRILGAMRTVLQTLLRGQDVVVHCAHGPQIENIMCVCHLRIPLEDLALSFEYVQGSRSIGAAWERAQGPRSIGYP